MQRIAVGPSIDEASLARMRVLGRHERSLGCVASSVCTRAFEPLLLRLLALLPIAPLLFSFSSSAE